MFSLCPRIWASGLGSPPSHPHQWPCSLTVPALWPEGQSREPPGHSAPWNVSLCCFHGLAQGPAGCNGKTLPFKTMSFLEGEELVINVKRPF